jgi:translation initiation factor 4A
VPLTPLSVPFRTQVEREEWKLDTLCDLLESLDSNNSTQAIVYVKTRAKTEWLAEKMAERDFTTACLRSDMENVEREAALRDFRNGSTRLLVVHNSLGPDPCQVSGLLIDSIGSLDQGELTAPSAT